jgi:cell division septation protein DedD
MFCHDGYTAKRTGEPCVGDSNGMFGCYRPSVCEWDGSTCKASIGNCTAATGQQWKVCVTFDIDDDPEAAGNCNAVENCWWGALADGPDGGESCHATGVSTMCEEIECLFTFHCGYQASDKSSCGSTNTQMASPHSYLPYLQYYQKELDCSAAPVTDPPVTDAPVAGPPVTDAPVTDPPVTDAPATGPPVTGAPVTDSPEQKPTARTASGSSVGIAVTATSAVLTTVAAGLAFL